MLREKILNFLQWNDKNGIFLDSDIKAMNQEPFTLTEATQLFIRNIRELEDMEFINFDITNEFRKNNKLHLAFIELVNGDDNENTYRKVISML